MDAYAGVTPEGTSFSSIISDGAVLQRGVDTAAVVYGAVLGGVQPNAEVLVTVDEEGEPAYKVAATVVHTDTAAGNLTWRAKLKPHSEYGGSVTITAACTTGCKFRRQGKRRRGICIALTSLDVLRHDII